MQLLTESLIYWTRNYFQTTKGKKAIIGISGGKDSTVCAAICSKAIGKENVIGILMPNGLQKDINDSIELCKFLDIPYKIINIENTYKTLINNIADNFNLTTQTLLNLAPRIRTTLLYGIAQTYIGGRVCNTSNKCELFVGWGTYGADTFGDFSPLGDLLVSDIINIGLDLDLPKHLVCKIPADGLTEKSDEDNLGVTYKEIENVILKNYDVIPKDHLDKILQLNKNSQFKRDAINLPKFIKE